MKVYEDVPVEEETIEMLDKIMEIKGLVNHNAVMNYLIGLHFLIKAKEEDFVKQDNEEGGRK